MPCTNSTGEWVAVVGRAYATVRSPTRIVSIMRMRRIAYCHGIVRAPSPGLRRRVLLARPARARAVPVVAVAVAAGGVAVRSAAGEARRDAVPWRVRWRADHRRVSRGHLVSWRDARVARTDRRRAFAGWPCCRRGCVSQIVSRATPFAARLR